MRIIIIAAIALLALTGCGNPSTDPGESSGDFNTTQVTLSDSRTVECVTWTEVNVGGYAGGIDCDWDNAR